MRRQGCRCACPTAGASGQHEAGSTPRRVGCGRSVRAQQGPYAVAAARDTTNAAAADARGSARLPRQIAAGMSRQLLPATRTHASGLWYACIVHTCERSYVPLHRRWRSASSSLPPPATPADQFGRRGRLRRWASKRSMHGVAGPRQRAPRLTGRSTLLAARGKRRCVPADPPTRPPAPRRAAPECSSVPSVVPTVAFRKRLVGSPSHRLPRCKESPGPLLPMLARAILCAHACA